MSGDWRASPLSSIVDLSLFFSLLLGVKLLVCHSFGVPIINFMGASIGH
jgi:hypothetical protein